MEAEPNGYLSSHNSLIVISLLLSLLSGNGTLFAQIYGTQTGNAMFEAETPLNSYKGESDNLQGIINLATGNLAFRVPVKSLKTGNDKRDEHMYELLEVEKNPDVIFEGKIMGDFDLDKKSEQTVKVQGDFTLGGTTRRTTIPMKVKLSSNGLQLNASWSLLITDYNLERPSFLFITIHDEHDLSVDALLEKR